MKEYNFKIKFDIKRIDDGANTDAKSIQKIIERAIYMHLCESAPPSEIKLFTVEELEEQTQEISPEDYNFSTFSHLAREY